MYTIIRKCDFCDHEEDIQMPTRGSLPHQLPTLGFMSICVTCEEEASRLLKASIAKRREEDNTPVGPPIEIPEEEQDIPMH